MLFGEGVSSRAPVWGASSFEERGGNYGKSFKSCPRVGGIREADNQEADYHGFKSCPRVGGICNFAQKACC